MASRAVAPVYYAMCVYICSDYSDAHPFYTPSMTNGDYQNICWINAFYKSDSWKSNVSFNDYFIRKIPKAWLLITVSSITIGLSFHGIVGADILKYFLHYFSGGIEHPFICAM